MKKINKLLTKLIFACMILTIPGLTTFAGSTDKDKRRSSSKLSGHETRPFDFSNDRYLESGVESDAIVSRRTGEDDYSVFDTAPSAAHRDVRITATSPAYNHNGEMTFFNYYGDLFVNSFTRDDDGKISLEQAEQRPIYVFPSRRYVGDRQAVMIDDSKSESDSNPLGISVVVVVEFNQLIDTSDHPTLLRLLARNGASLDGTPIIRTTDELNELIRYQLVTAKVKGLSDPTTPSYVVAPKIADPTQGAVADDAYLITVLGSNEKPLASEEFFAEEFECLRKRGEYCTPEFRVDKAADKKSLIRR